MVGEKTKLIRKAISGTMLISLLFGVLFLALQVHLVGAGGTIYIRTDGSTDPPTAPIQRVGDVYTFISNVYDEIVIERYNIVVDGAGFTVQGTQAYESKGISLYGSNVTIKDTTIRWFGYGIRLYSFSNTISGNNITANDNDGISLYHCSNNTISGNNITANDFGIYLYDCSNNTISGNNIANNDEGIALGDSSSSNTVSENDITANGEYGIGLWGSSNNTISGNNIANNVRGIYLEYSSNNQIYHNSFIDIAKPVVLSSTDFLHPSINMWDNGFPSGGNYWSDYTGTYTNGDGIGDTPYVIDANNQDRYPLMNPWAPPSVGAKAGDWIKLDYTITGASSGTPLPQWLKVEFLSVEGKTTIIRVTMHMSDGTEPSQTMNIDVVIGSRAFQGLSGFVIPANCTTGDSVHMSGYGNVTIAGETTRTYAGASRKIVYASISQLGSALTYYWDKQTGVMVEASTTSGSISATGKATETNMWQAQPGGLSIDPTIFYILIIAAIAIVGGVALLVMRRKKKPPKEVTLPQS